MKQADKVVCTNAKGDRLVGVVMHVFADGGVLVDVGKPEARRNSDRDARVFNAGQVKKEVEL